ncbi:MAG: DUF4340 domain-containing protein [bacterium]|nr:DUF4340 domain-containing protein [bacterium]
MSNKSIKKEYILLVVIIVVLLGYLSMKKQDKVHYDLPKLEAVAGDSITKIEIVKPDGTVTLVNKDKKWVIEPKGYPTDAAMANEIVNAVKDLKLTTLASESKNFSRYGLGKEKLIKVKAFNKDRVVREFEIGKVTATNNHTFVKLKDDTRVYHAQKSFRKHFEKKGNDLRDKLVMKLDKNEISEIAVEKEKAKFVFSKEASGTAPAPTPLKPDPKQPPVPPAAKGEPTWKTADGKEGNKTGLDGILSQLADLKCDEFIEDKKKEDFTKPIYTIKLKGQKDYTLNIYEKIKVPGADGKEGTEKYPVVSSENAYPFLLTTYSAERLIKKEEDLIKKEVKEEKK